MVSRRNGSFTGTPDHSSIRKWIWWMWNACNSVERFSMIQSSTSPCLTTISGTLEEGSNALGVSPSTVMKNVVGLLGSFGSRNFSEKYNLRVRAGVTLPSQGSVLGG